MENQVHKKAVKKVAKSVPNQPEKPVRLLKLALSQGDVPSSTTTVYDSPSIAPRIGRELHNPPPLMWGFEAGLMVGRAVIEREVFRLIAFKCQGSVATRMEELAKHVNLLAGYKAMAVTSSNNSNFLDSPIGKRKTPISPLRFTLPSGATPTDRFAIVDYENINNLSRQRCWMFCSRILVLMGKGQEVLRLPGDFWENSATKDRLIPVSPATSTPSETFIYRQGREQAHLFSATRISQQGPNVLDKHLAFYLGLYMALLPTQPIYIISNDRGYNRLIKAVREQMHTTRINQLHPDTGEWLAS